MNDVAYFFKRLLIDAPYNILLNINIINILFFI